MKKNYETPELNKISFLPDESIMDDVTLPGGELERSEGSGDLPDLTNIGL